MKPVTHTLSWTTLCLLLLPPLLWAGNFIAGRAVSTSVPPVALALIRWSIALVCLLPFAWRPCLRDWAHYWQYRWSVLGTAITGVLAFNLLVYWGLHATSATNGIILNSFIPFLVAILGFVFYGQRLHAMQIVGLCISLLGVLAVVSRGEWAVLTELAFANGDVLILLAMFCWALYTLWLRNIPPHIERTGLMLCQVVIALLILWPLAMWEHPHVQAHITQNQTWWALAYIGIFPSVIAFLAYSKAVALVGSVRASMFIHAMPVFGSLLSTGLLGEALQGYQLLGMFALFGGIGIAQLKR